MLLSLKDASLWDSQTQGKKVVFYLLTFCVCVRERKRGGNGETGLKSWNWHNSWITGYVQFHSVLRYSWNIYKVKVTCYMQVLRNQNDGLWSAYHKPSNQHHQILPIKNADSWIPVRPIELESIEPLDTVTYEYTCWMANLKSLKYETHCFRGPGRREQRLNIKWALWWLCRRLSR